MNVTSNSTQSLDRDVYLEEMNSKFAAIIMPAIIVLAVLMLIGITGNIIVLYVYCRRMKSGTITRYIQGLAIFDLLSCSIAIPGEIIDMTNNYTFGANPMCQIVRTVNLLCTMVSGCILIVVAIDRFKRICYPLGRQITPQCALIIMITCAILALLFSLPTCVIFGPRTIPTNVSYINGSDCSVNDRFVHTIIPLIYNGSQMLVFVVGALILVVLYTIIARRIFQHAHERQRRRSGSCSWGRPRRRIWSMSYCSSPSLTPESLLDTHTSPRSRGHPEEQNVFIFDRQYMNNKQKKKSHDCVRNNSIVSKKCRKETSNNSYCKRSNSCNGFDVIKQNRFFSFKFTKGFKNSDYKGADSKNLVQPSCVQVNSNNDSHLNERRKTQSLPNRFKLNCEKSRSVPSNDSHDLSPPPTPVHQLHDQKCWLLTSHCSTSSQASRDDGEGLNNNDHDRSNNESNNEKDENTYVFKTEVDNLDRNEESAENDTVFSGQSDDIPCCTATKATQATNITNQEQETIIPIKRRSMRLSFKSLNDFRRIRILSDYSGTRRTTLMLFVITLVYILSFLPHLLLMILKAQGINWLSYHGDSGEVLHNLLIRSYFINSAANPVIYSFFSNNFFAECKHVIRGFCKKR